MLIQRLFIKKVICKTEHDMNWAKFVAYDGALTSATTMLKKS